MSSGRAGKDQRRGFTGEQCIYSAAQELMHFCSCGLVAITGEDGMHQGQESPHPNSGTAEKAI